MTQDARTSSRNPFRLDGRTALVTGASRGLGRAMALALADAGADVVCAGSRPGSADATASQIEVLGRRAWSVHADMTDSDQVRNMITQVDDLADTVHILVNNAGTIERHPAVDTPDDSWDRVIQTNLTAPFVLCRHFGAAMIQSGGGKIINIASLLTFSGGITVPSYASSKHAIAGLTKALCNEWASRNVQVNAIAPGYFKTDNTAALQADPKRYADILARIPAGAWGEPGQLAGAVVFLASPASDYVNGHVLTVDGGWMAR